MGKSSYKLLQFATLINPCLFVFVSDLIYKASIENLQPLVISSVPLLLGCWFIVALISVATIFSISKSDGVAGKFFLLLFLSLGVTTFILMAAIGQIEYALIGLAGLASLMFALIACSIRETRYTGILGSVLASMPIIFALYQGYS